MVSSGAASNVMAIAMTRVIGQELSDQDTGAGEVARKHFGNLPAHLAHQLNSLVEDSDGA